MQIFQIRKNVEIQLEITKQVPNSSNIIHNQDYIS